MVNVDYFSLISGTKTRIPITDICYVKQPSLDDIRNLGYLKYLELTNLLLYDKETFLDKLSDKGATIDTSSYSILDLLLIRQDTREALLEALSFYIDGEVRCVGKFNAIKISSKYFKTDRYLDGEKFEDLQCVIQAINFIEPKKETPKKFKNAKAKEIFEKINKGKSKCTQMESAINIPNIISAIVANHGAYTYENIWDLTVYQLYDLFFRLDLKLQIAVISTRWAAWGEDDFDFSMWYKNPIKKSKGDNDK